MISPELLEQQVNTLKKIFTQHENEIKEIHQQAENKIKEILKQQEGITRKVHNTYTNIIKNIIENFNPTSETFQPPRTQSKNSYYAIPRNSQCEFGCSGDFINNHTENPKSCKSNTDINRNFHSEDNYAEQINLNYCELHFPQPSEPYDKIFREASENTLDTGINYSSENPHGPLNMVSIPTDAAKSKLEEKDSKVSKSYPNLLQYESESREEITNIEQTTITAGSAVKADNLCMETENHRRLKRSESMPCLTNFWFFFIKDQKLGEQEAHLKDLKQPFVKKKNEIASRPLPPIPSSYNGFKNSFYTKSWRENPSYMPKNRGPQYLNPQTRVGSCFLPTRGHSTSLSLVGLRATSVRFSDSSDSNSIYLGMSPPSTSSMNVFPQIIVGSRENSVYENIPVIFSVNTSTPTSPPPAIDSVQSTSNNAEDHYYQNTSAETSTKKKNGISSMMHRLKKSLSMKTGKKTKRSDFKQI